MVSEDENATRQTEVWKEALSHPNWYIRLENFLRNDIFPVEHDNPQLQKKRNEFFAVVEEMLESGTIPLAKEGPDLDAERQPVDTIVIHHTEGDPDISLSRLNAIGFVRQYAMNYLDNNIYGHANVRGQAIWSGHFRGGQQVFFAYHWLIRPDGRTERLLNDKDVGHHAAVLNPNSIGISLSGNYEHATPPIEQIKTAADVIKKNYAFVDTGKILGHKEVMQGRTCPGDQFLGGWKHTLLEAAKRRF